MLAIAACPRLDMGQRGVASGKKKFSKNAPTGGLGFNFAIFRACEANTKTTYGYRCDERLKTNVKESV
jgi:hypothetical protein